MTIDAERLRQLDLFVDLDSYDLSQVCRWVHEVRADAGDALFEQGAIPYEMFVIEQGEVEVVRDGEVLAKLGPGETVGAWPRSAPPRRWSRSRSRPTISPSCKPRCPRCGPRSAPRWKSAADATSSTRTDLDQRFRRVAASRAWVAAVASNPSCFARTR